MSCRVSRKGNHRRDAGSRPEWQTLGEVVKVFEKWRVLISRGFYFTLLGSWRGPGVGVCFGH